MSEIKIRADDIVTVAVSDIKPNPKNMNQHPADQIDRLCKIIEYQGFRTPLIISKQSGFLVAGHGRLEAAKKLKLSHLPVIYQDFVDQDQEYAAMVSDNSIASWAELDFSAINAELDKLGPFDIDLLGIKNFKIDCAGLPDVGQANGIKEELLQCPGCGFIGEKDKFRHQG